MICINLFNKNEQEYGVDYKNHLLEQWKICIEMADKISERRVNVNNFFITLNSSILALTAFMVKGKEFIITFIGIFVSILWIMTISNYKKLNSVKFKIINELEMHLPTKPYNYEWHLIGQGNDKKKYKRLTEMEKFIPIFFIVIYITILILKIIK